MKKSKKPKDFRLLTCSIIVSTEIFLCNSSVTTFTPVNKSGKYHSKKRIKLEVYPELCIKSVMSRQLITLTDVLDDGQFSYSAAPVTSDYHILPGQRRLIHLARRKSTGSSNLRSSANH